MKSKKISTSLKGEYSRQKNAYLYKDALILCKRRGSTVVLEDDAVFIHADVTGIDKIYFEIKNNQVTISNIFKDFLDNDINEEFMDFQKLRGYVPYPFTILKGVMKAPPGLVTKIYPDENGELQHNFMESDALAIFNVDKHFNKRLFREGFKKLLLENATAYKELVSSFSGGFDSTFLTSIYSSKCTRILHFSEGKTEISRYKKIFPNSKWTIIDSNENFSDADKKKYFGSIDEPSCDSSGFAEYLMIKKIKNEEQDLDGDIIIMNGQGCDGLFTNGRTYFQEFIASRMPRYIKNMTKNRTNDSKISSKIRNYSLETKKRFMEIYLKDYTFSDRIHKGISDVYDMYAGAIKNDSANILAACIVLMKYSIHGIEKIRTAAHAFGIRYYLPFMSENVIEYAFSIPSKYKVGYTHGKKILIKEYPEISKISFVTGAFLPQKLKERFIGAEPSDSKYNGFYIQNWIDHNKL
jgi:asparagine synthetase B (glutamine-hydrolysing)